MVSAPEPPKAAPRFNESPWVLGGDHGAWGDETLRRTGEQRHDHRGVRAHVERPAVVVAGPAHHEVSKPRQTHASRRAVRMTSSRS